MWSAVFLVRGWGVWNVGNWNGPSWSLSAEWLAYLGFPLLAAAICPIRSIGLLLCGAGASLALTVLTLVLAGYQAPNGFGLSGMARMAGEFPAGCLLYAAYARGLRISGVFAVGLAVLLAGVWLAVPFAAFTLVVLPAYLIMLSAQGTNPVGRWLSCRPVMVLGRISFSLYMTHWIIIQVFVWLGWHGLDWPPALVDLPVALPTAVVTHHGIERPAQRLGRRMAVPAASDLAMGPALRP